MIKKSVFYEFLRMGYLSLLRLFLPNISAEAKLVLLRFLQRYGEGGSANRGVAALAADLGVTGPMVKRELPVLMAGGFLSQGVLNAKCECSESLRETIAAENEKGITSPLDQLADQVLNPAKELMSLKSYDRRMSGTSLEPVTPAQRKGTARMRLGETASGTNRLLLAVLLIHADEFGVVRGLGITDLCALTGLKRERLEMQLFKLNELGAIRFKVAGFSGSKVLGSLKTLYYLNLHHRCFPYSTNTAMVLVVQGKNDSKKNLNTHAEALFFGGEGQHGCDFYWPLIDQDPLGPVNLFDKTVVSTLLESRLAGGGRAELLMLQTIVDKHVSSLLSRHWSSLSSKEPFTDEALLKLIKSEVKLPRQRSSHLKVAVDATVDKVVYMMVFSLACQYRTLLDSALGAGGEGMEFHILPISDQARGRSVLVLHKSVVRDPRCWIITEGQSDIQIYESEAVMPVAQHFDYGLLSRFHALKRYGRPTVRRKPSLSQ